MRYVISGANVVPDIALSTVVLNLKFLTCEKTGGQQAGIQQKKAESRTPLFLSLNQDIVVWSQKEKCRVDLGGHPPKSPSDPDVRNYRIRLLDLRIRYLTEF
jgi:hypothetical protein